MMSGKPGHESLDFLIANRGVDLPQVRQKEVEMVRNPLKLKFRVAIATGLVSQYQQVSEQEILVQDSSRA